VYERTYPHAIDLVFEAVSTGEHLDVWLLPESRVERRVGGACAFGWGSPADAPGATQGTVTVFEPPNAVQYSYTGSESYIRFDLEADGPESTHLRFTLHFLPAPDEHEDAWPGGDLPAPGTAWKPGFCAGFHDFLDDLRKWLDGELDIEAKAAWLATGEGHREEERWIEPYREHIRDNCPAD
jgi:uncharacterized protein YndB with AHSA1/START domain